MLVALRVSGQYISLLDELDRAKLAELRLSDTFFCPVCKKRVQLKLGTKRIYHFAHEEGAECSEKNEPETPYHLKGKQMIYGWLKQQYPNTEIEKYLPEISQRPDIYVEINNRRYAIEYQCSRISYEMFEKRTKNYLNVGIIPIWIVGNTWLKMESSNCTKLSPFLWQFASTMGQSQPALYYFCPQSSLFTMITSLLPFSTSQAYCRLTSTQMNNLSLFALLDHQRNSSKPFYLTDWFNEKSRLRINLSVYPSLKLRKLLIALYEQRIPPSLLPAEAGLPVPSMYWIQTPAIIWQTWILLDSLLSLKSGDIISFKQVYSLFNKRVKMKEIVIRKLLLAGNTHYSFAIMEYLQVLTKLKVLRQIDKLTFEKIGEFYIPKNELQAQKEELLMAKRLKVVYK